MSAISRDDFARVDIRLGTIVEASPFPGSRKIGHDLDRKPEDAP